MEKCFNELTKFIYLFIYSLFNVDVIYLQKKLVSHMLHKH